MSSLNEYIESVKIAIHRLDDYGLAKSIELKSEFRNEDEIFVTSKVILINDSEIYLREYVNGKNGIERIDYSYQYQAADKTLIFRYDNSKHKPPLGFDDHKHQRDASIIPWPIPSIDEIVDEVIAGLG
ncbi:toxin-antitoxin system TumE family protein [Argonema antarcticum]|uniref:toxin-antitoxin system TumE family protein n=1 Tax=Argonema antarcticum TaxID=2942763 RepID=UPI002012545F|nr:DUF6516 family protein [Argonema antarcticum]MCL1471147.1 DUF6516 family protein [Argonema antarcticum A004/B2]